MINSPSAHHSIYGAKSNVTKGTYYKLWARRIDDENTWNAIDHEIHARKRRVLNHAFSENAIRSAEPFVIQHVNRWCELLGQNTEREWSEPRDMAHWANYLMFDILGDLCFGKSMGIKEQEENELRNVPYFIASFMTVFHNVRLAWLFINHLLESDGF